MLGRHVRSLLLLLLGCCFLLEDFTALVHGSVHDRVPLPDEAPPNVEWYFWNELTGETQWEDPGDVAYEDAHAQRYWMADSGEHLRYDPKAHRYSWVENWSSEHSRPFYFNQKTKTSQWDKPIDLAWRRVTAFSDAGIRTHHVGANRRVMEEL